MKRCAAKVVMFLLLGAIVNVAVAWASAAWLPLGNARPVCAQLNSEHRVRWVNLVEQRRVGLVRMEVRGFSQRIGNHQIEIRELPRWSKLGEQLPRPNNGSADHVITWSTEVSTGLPFRSHVAWRTTTPSLEYGLEISDLPPTFASHGRVLPLLPIWPGFAINTMFYAAVLWVVFAMPFVVRRRRRGLCPACAYPVGQSPVCTECGAALSSTA